jgi:hypothetical protein
LTDMVFRLFFEIREMDGFQEYGTVLLHCIQGFRSYASSGMFSEPYFSERKRSIASSTKVQTWTNSRIS